VRNYDNGSQTQQFYSKRPCDVCYYRRVIDGS